MENGQTVIQKGGQTDMQKGGLETGRESRLEERQRTDRQTGRRACRSWFEHFT